MYQYGMNLYRTYSILSTLFVFISSSILAQKEINGKVSAGDSVQVTVNYVHPSQFPSVEVLFNAEDMEGYPYWGLEKSDLKVFENDQECEIISLRHLSEEEPINIMLILDHSGSMGPDFNELVKLGSQYQTMDYTSFYKDTSWLGKIDYPLGNAVEAIKGFIPNFNQDKDHLGLVTFSTVIDGVYPITSEQKKLCQVLDTIKPHMSTAFYDAIMKGVDELSGEEGINVVIALTDGLDNSSIATPKDVIDRVNQDSVTLFCIGLGYAEVDTLQYISESTDGFFIYTNNSSSLDSIYQILERKIQAHYLLTYTSDNWNELDVTREFVLDFNAEKIELSGNSLKFELSDEVVAYIKENKPTEETYEYYLYGGGIALVSLIGFSVWFFRKKKPQLNITKIYPNPGNGKFKIELDIPQEIDQVNLTIQHSSGQIIYDKMVSESIKTFDLSKYPKGIYLVTISHDNYKPDAKKYIKQ